MGGQGRTGPRPAWERWTPGPSAPDLALRARGPPLPAPAPLLRGARMRQGTRFGAPRRRGLHAPAWIEPVGGLTGKHALLLLMRRLGARRRGCGPLHLALLWGRGRGPLHLTRLRGGRGGALHAAGAVRRLTPPRA